MNRIWKILCGAVCAFVFCFLAIGYAAVQDELIVNGSVSVEQYYLKYDFSSTDTDGYTLADDGTLKIEEIYYDELAKKNYRVVTIAENGFSDYTNKAGVTALDLPDSLIGIGENAFSDFTMLSYVEFGAGFTEFKDTSFSGCSYLTEDAMYVPSDSLVVRNQLGADITAFELNGQNYTIELVSTYADERGVVTSYQGEEKQIYAYATVSQSKFELAENGEVVDLIPTTQYTYATLDASNGLHIKNRYCYLIENDTKLVEADKTYTIASEIYKLPECFVAGNVPTDAISGQWRVGYNTNNTFEQSITSVIVEDKIALADSGTTYMFQSFTALKTVNLEKVDFSKATSLEGMFDNCNQMTSVKFAADIDTSSVTSMYKLFYLCKNLTDLDVTGLDTGAVKNMSHMFDTCSSLTVLNVTGFNTAQVTDMSFMFAGCSKVTSLNVSNFKTSNVKNMTNMFASCSGLTELDVTKFDTGNVQNMDSFVAMCSGLTALDVSKLNTQSVTNMRNMFARCTGLTTLDIREWNTPNLQNTSLMFTGCTNLSTLLWDDSFNTSKVTDMEGMFKSCISFTTLDLTSFNTSEVKNMKNMFNGFKATSLNISNFDTSKVTTMEGMFHGCNLTTLNLSSFDTKNVQNMRLMFFQCTSLTALDLSNFTTTSLLTDMREMFYQCGQLTELDLSGFDTSKVKDMNNLFGQCKKLTTIYVSDKFVTDSVTDSSKIFDQCNVLKGGNGTEWSVSDIAYARIDGGTEAPGYFTDKNAINTQTLEMDGLTHLNASCEPAEIIPGQAFNITLTPDAGYVLPDTVTVTINGEDKTAEVTYENGVITIPATLTTGNITISVSAEAEQQIEVTDSFADGLTAIYDPVVPIPGQPLTIYLSGETFPEAVTVKIDGVEAATAVYDKDTGTITIPGDLLTATTTSITLEAVEITPAVCTCEAKCSEPTETCEVCKTDITNCVGTEVPTEAEPTCTCETKCTELTETCEVCKTDITNCVGTEPTQPVESSEHRAYTAG